MDTFNGSIRPIAKIDDIIYVKGYGFRMFRVYAITYEYHRDAENELEEIYYDIVCMKTYECLVADQEDNSIVTEEEETSIDDLLADLSDALAMQELFGEHEDHEKKDRKYSLRVCELKAKLREQSNK